MVALPASTLMEISLRIESRSADASPQRLSFVAPLIAQEIRAVRGSYTLHTVPPREGQIDGTFGGASFLTAGNFAGTFTETTPSGCLAQRNYSGPVTAAGINLLGGRMLQQCPETPFNELGAIAISVAEGTGTPDPDPNPNPDPDPDPDPSQRLRLTISLDGSGLGTVTSQPAGINCGTTCSATYDQGTVVALIATSDPGSTFSGWSGAPDCTDGEVTMTAARRCTATFDTSSAPTRRLTVGRAGTGSGTVTSNPGGINCGGDCSQDYAEGTTVALNTSTTAGSTFTGWSGDPDCSDGQVTMNGVRNCTATFNLSEVTTHTLTMTLAGSGGGTATSSPIGIDCGGDCMEDFQEGSIVSLIADPDAGSTFAGWSGAGCASGTVTMNAPRVCTATFNLIPPGELAVTVTGTGFGTVTSSPKGITCDKDSDPDDCSEEYSVGTIVTLTADPGDNSTFGGWTGDDDCTDGSVTMDAAHGCTATFTQITHTLTVVPAGSGVGFVTDNFSGINCGGDCTGDYPQGTVVTLTATPAAGSRFGGWSGDCTGMASTTNVTMNAAKSSCIATFTQQFTLTAEQVGSSVGNITSDLGAIDCGSDCSELYDDGTPVTLTAPAAAMGWTFDGWSNGCSGAALVTNVTVDAAKTCTATYTLDPVAQFTLTVE